MHEGNIPTDSQTVNNNILTNDSDMEKLTLKT